MLIRGDDPPEPPDHGGAARPPYPPGGPFHVVVRRRREAELAVQAVRVRGVQHPAEPCARALLDHHRDDGLAQAAAAVRGQHVHVGQVGGPAVAERAGEADHRANRVVRPDDPPGRGDLAPDVRLGAPPGPVGLGGQERRRGRGIDPGRVVVELVAPCHAGHRERGHHSTSRAWSMSVIRSAAGSTPTDSRIRPGGAVSAGQPPRPPGRRAPARGPPSRGCRPGRSHGPDAGSPARRRRSPGPAAAWRAGRAARSVPAWISRDSAENTSAIECRRMLQYNL